MKRAARAFWDFWWDFLIGDAPEFAIITLVVVALAFALRHHRDVGVVVLPVITLGAVAISAARVRRS